MSHRIEELIKDKDNTWPNIVSILNEEGILTPSRGRKWTSSSLASYAHRHLPHISKRGDRETPKRKNIQYTDKEKDERKCSECKLIKSYYQDFYFQVKREDGYKYPRPECKECWRKISAIRQNEKKIDNEPDRYWQCECFHVNKNTRTLCFKCGQRESSEI